MLQLSRALQGVGGAVMFAVSLALLAGGFRGKDRRTAFGAWGAGTGLAGAVGPLPGGRRSAHPMFDLMLFRLPTFSGGSVAAFGLSASIFAMLLYLVLCLQDILGYSALATGVRLRVISGGILVAATVAGRLSSRVPVRL